MVAGTKTGNTVKESPGQGEAGGACQDQHQPGLQVRVGDNIGLSSNRVLQASPLGLPGDPGQVPGQADPVHQDLLERQR